MFVKLQPVRRQEQQPQVSVSMSVKVGAEQELIDTIYSTKEIYMSWDKKRGVAFTRAAAFTVFCRPPIEPMGKLDACGFHTIVL